MRHHHSPLLVALASAIVLLALVPAGTMAAGSDNNVGKHVFKVNIIGRPNDYSGDGADSNGRSLFIGLDTAKGGGDGGDICEDASGVTDDTADGTALDMVPENKEQLHFSTGDGFAMIDRDATDGRAEIQVPENIGELDVYVRILGKPGGCLDSDAYAYDGDQYYFAGHLDANRKTGAPSKVKVNDLFDVWYDTDGDGVLDSEISVFDSAFEDYFWQISNQGLRNMQLIFVEA